MKLRVFPILALVALPHLALAADPVPKNDPAAAQVLFYEARTLMQQGKYAEACPKLEESMRLDAGLGTQFNLADCHEHVGKIASAWAGFLEVAASAKATNQLDREKVARKRAQALDARLPKLVVDVTGAPAGLDVKRDGIPIGSAAWGTPIPVDPGAHRITATAPNKGTWESSITTSEGKISHIAIPRDLPPAPVAATPPPAVGPQPETPATATSVPTATTATTAASDFPAPVVEDNGSAQRTVGWVVAGVGVVGVGVGAGFGLSSLGKRNESRTHCVVDACDAVGVGLRDDAIRNGNIATVATIAGGAALAGGILLVLTAPKSSESHERAGKLHAVPNVGLNGGGLSLQGNFQ